jgi:NDP-sugar pyrophosphorylase family protein
VRGFVLAGGLGTRLAPYTTVLPKPLLPLGRSTILERVIAALAASEVQEVTISLGYLGHLVRAVIGDGSALGVRVDYTTEDEPLGTAGALRLMRDLEDDDVVIAVNGDTLTDFDFRLARRALVERGCDAVIVTKQRTTHVDYGVVETDSSGSLLTYVEKPQIRHLVSTGMNAFRGSAIIEWLPAGRVDMPDFLREIQTRGGTVHCLTTSASWYDLGRPEDLIEANATLAAED